MYLITAAHSTMCTVVSRFLALLAHTAIIHLIKVMERWSLTLTSMACESLLFQYHIFEGVNCKRVIVNDWTFQPHI